MIYIILEENMLEKASKHKNICSTSYFVDIDNLKTDSKVYIERQKTQKSQHSIKREEQSWRIDTIWLQGLL